VQSQAVASDQKSGLARLVPSLPEDGKISLHATEAIANKFTTREQNRWLETELERRCRKIEGERTAAAVIMDFLGAGVFDLSRIGAAIREAIRF
jgi:hypothetical protein